MAEIKYNPTIEMEQFIEYIQHKMGKPWIFLSKDYVLARKFLVDNKDDFIELFNEENYQRQLDKLSKTKAELRDEKKIREQQNQEKIERRKQYALETERIKAKAFAAQQGVPVDDEDESEVVEEQPKSKEEIIKELKEELADPTPEHIKETVRKRLEELRNG